MLLCGTKFNACNCTRDVTQQFCTPVVMSMSELIQEVKFPIMYSPFFTCVICMIFSCFLVIRSAHVTLFFSAFASGPVGQDPF